MADFPVPHGPVSDAKSRLAAPIHAERHVNVICIGAGASGLLMAYKVQKHFKNMSITIFEKNEDVSGTWYENRYPGYVDLVVIPLP
jgi:monoamine oxidase